MLPDTIEDSSTSTRGLYFRPSQGRRVILWETLSPESQQKCLTELQNDEEWVIWCKAKPKDRATQAFREYGKCIFEDKRAKVTQDNDNVRAMDSFSAGSRLSRGVHHTNAYTIAIGFRNNNLSL